MGKTNKIIAAQLLILCLGGRGVIAQTPPGAAFCGSAPQPAFCSAVRGVRSEGWPGQSRSEVMA